MIPSTVTRDHVIAAIEHVRRRGVPSGRASRGYELVVDGQRLPPKYVVAVAIELATGTHPSSNAFGGGVETNGFLERLGFTVVVKGEPLRQRLRVGRVFLDLGVRQGQYRADPAGKARAFGKLSSGAFHRDPGAYVSRIVGSIRRARDAGCDVVALPACALQVAGGVTLDAYRVPEVPIVVAGGATTEGEFAVVVRHGVAGERFDASRVHWLAGPGFSLMVAISSTIGQAIETRYQPPVRSTRHPPRVDQPVLVVDVGHAQYSSRYDFNTLRCVARDVEQRVGRPSALVLSSWMWSTRGIGTGWCHPRHRVQVERLAGADSDHLDVIDFAADAHA